MVGGGEIRCWVLTRHAQGQGEGNSCDRHRQKQGGRARRVFKNKQHKTKTTHHPILPLRHRPQTMLLSSQRTAATILLLLVLMAVVSLAQESSNHKDPRSHATHGLAAMVEGISERLKDLQTEITFYSTTFANFTKTLPSWPTWMSSSTSSADEM